MSGNTYQGSSQPAPPRYDVDSLLQATDAVPNSSFSGADDPNLAECDKLFDQYVCPDAYTTSAPSGWAPHLLESTIDPHSPSMLFYSGTTQDLPVTQSASALCEYNDPSPGPRSAGAPLAWPIETDPLGASSSGDPVNGIPQYYDHSIPYITDIMCPAAALPDPCLPAASSDEFHGLPDIPGLGGAFAPASTVTPTRAETRSMRAYSPYPSPSTSSSTSRPSSRASHSSDVPTHQPPRNLQIPLDHFRKVMKTHTGWKCPFCPYEQTKQRSPDMKRHLATHCPEAALLLRPDSSDATAVFRCCGIPLEKALAYGVKVPETSKHLLINGVHTVRGCGMTFSRRDALLRHVNNVKNDCIDEKALHRLVGKGPARCAKKASLRV